MVPGQPAERRGKMKLKKGDRVKVYRCAYFAEDCEGVGTLVRKSGETATVIEPYERWEVLMHPDERPVLRTVHPGWKV